MKRPFTLVRDNISTDTVQCLDTLLEQARKGEVIGLAFVAILKRRNYVVNTAGEAHRNPTFARGCVGALDDELGRRIRPQ
jgi:hypothetical protein